MSANSHVVQLFKKGVLEHDSIVLPTIAIVDMISPNFFKPTIKASIYSPFILHKLGYNIDPESKAVHGGPKSTSRFLKEKLAEYLEILGSPINSNDVDYIIIM